MNACVAVVLSSESNTQICSHETHLPFKHIIKSEVNAACPPPTSTMFDGHAWWRRTNSPRVSCLSRDLQEFVKACKQKAWAWVCGAPSILDAMFPDSWWHHLLGWRLSQALRSQHDSGSIVFNIYTAETTKIQRKVNSRHCLICKAFVTECFEWSIKKTTKKSSRRTEIKHQRAMVRFLRLLQVLPRTDFKLCGGEAVGAEKYLKGKCGAV